MIMNLLIACLLTPLSKVLLEKLINSQLVKKFPVFYVTQRFITAFTSDRHLSLSTVNSYEENFTVTEAKKACCILLLLLLYHLYTGY